MVGGIRWISSMKSTSRSLRLLSIAARSPGFSSTGPDVDRTGTPISLPDDVGERGLAQARRAVEQDVVERLAALPGRRDRHDEVLADALLPDVLVERARPEPRLELRVIVHARRCDRAGNRTSVATHELTGSGRGFGPWHVQRVRCSGAAPAATVVTAAAASTIRAAPPSAAARTSARPAPSAPRPRPSPQGRDDTPD